MENERNTSLTAFKAARRRPLSLTRESLVRTGFLNSDNTLPVVMEPEIEGLNPGAWAQNARHEIESQLLKYGAILFRNFNLDSVNKFDQFVKAISTDLIEYCERSSPRSEIMNGIYTSTDYPSDQSIHFHNEQSYTRRWPMKLWFYCNTPPEKGGATPIADGRRVLSLLSPALRDRFLEKKVMYIRNYGDGMGLTWQTAFQTDKEAEAESYCRKASISFEWKDKGRLRTRQIFDAIARHPKTGEFVWFEHTAFFHISSLQPEVRTSILAEFKEEDLPFNTYYGDGSTIEDSALEEIREAYRKTAVSFPWQKGDLLLIDNMLTSHGREPFAGPRKILVAMTDLYSISSSV